MEKDAALKHGRDLCKEGASVLDVGAESTRPGADIVDAETEISRLIPVIKALKEEIDLPVSADTYKAVTAAALPAPWLPTAKNLKRNPERGRSKTWQAHLCFTSLLQQPKFHKNFQFFN